MSLTLGVVSMAQPQHSHGYLSNMLGIGCPADSLKPMLRCPGSGSKFESLSDSEMRKMAIDLLVVKNFTLDGEKMFSKKVQRLQ